MRILVIFTGGTIGCARPDAAGVLRLDMAAQDSLLQGHTDTVDFDICQPFTCLSENMTTAHWLHLARTVAAVETGQYTGVIVTHGTDTLAWTAAFLGIALAGFPLPVVLVSADRPLSDPATNGRRNFSAAVSFIRQSGCTGVFAACGDTPDTTEIHLGTRLRQAEPFDHRFSSPGGADFGYVADDQFHRRSSFRPVPQQPVPLPERLDPAVLLIHPHTGLDYSCFSLDGVRAVLHIVYHSHTVFSEGKGPNSVLYLQKRCEERGIPLFLAPFSGKLLDGPHYVSTEAALGSGIRFLCGQTAETAYAKLLLAVNLFEETGQIVEFAEKIHFYENIEIEY